MAVRQDLERKGLSPFSPGQPVPIEYFVGRRAEIERIRRAASAVSAGRQQAVFIAGEYGIGKSSLANMVRSLSEFDYGLLGNHVLLSGAETLDAVSFRVVQGFIESKASTVENARELLGKYIKGASVLGFDLNVESLRRDSHEISQNFLGYLRQFYARVRGKFRGIVLILDEINGLASRPFFGPFLKGLVDGNALSAEPIPLLLVLCGTDERRRQIIQQHKPVERIFEVAILEPMTDAESAQFFTQAFGRIGMTIEKEALAILQRISGGLPRLMHLVGDAAFWAADDGKVTADTASEAIISAADEVGRKFVDQQVVRALKSKLYRGILMKLARTDFGLTFLRTDIETMLSLAERKNFGNFLTRMKKLKVLESGEARGEYRFNDWLTRIYLNMLAERENPRMPIE